MEKRFRALRIVAAVWKILAWIVLVLGGLLALGVVIIGAIQGRVGYPSDVLAPVPVLGAVTGPIMGIVMGVGLLLAALVQFVLTYAVGEVIELGLSIEQNTRETAYYLKGENTIPAPPLPVSWETPVESLEQDS
ncbi:MAG: hypothetical protein JXA74_02955 [Anaerolineae bacterium]|nr:hypothetical protein [Anaerolineae bacterium]